MKFSSIICTIALVLVKSLCFAQKENVIEHEELIKEYLQKKRFEIDTTAQAVILYERGYSSLIEGYLEYHIERTVKILGPKAVSEFGIVNIPKGTYSSITKIKGVTYNINNDLVNKQIIEKSDILKDKVTDGLTVAKFNLPDVQVGSIIHYSYTISSSGFIFVPNWEFQGDYPKLYSEYKVLIPQYIIYTPLERVNTFMKKVESIKELSNYEASTFSESLGSRGTGQTWVRKNIPVFKSEPYMSSSDNFKERIKIHVSALYHQGHTAHIYNDWGEFIKKSYYLNDELAGQITSANNFLNEKVRALTLDKNTKLEKAQSIFAYIRNNFSAKESSSGYKALTNIKDIFSKGEGSAAGINILLTAMLKKADLDSDPVVLSTRSNEKLNEAFPDPRDINYLVSKVAIDNKDYFLDASVKQMPFGTLLPECYNGYCRIVNEMGGFTYLEPENITDKTIVVVSIKPDQADKNKFSLKFSKQFGLFSGIHYRKEWNEDTSEIRKMILKEINRSTTDIQLKDYTIDNLGDPDKPLRMNYEAIGELAKTTDASTIYLDPYFEKFCQKNPFTSETRNFGIEMNYLEDCNYILHFQLPEGYVLDDFPKSTVKQFSEKSLIIFKNSIDYKPGENSFSIASRLFRKTTQFQAEDYAELKNFYGIIAEEQNKKFIIKKLK
jgi:hypothetical protein